MLLGGWLLEDRLQGAKQLPTMSLLLLLLLLAGGCPAAGCSPSSLTLTHASLGLRPSTLPEKPQQQQLASCCCSGESGLATFKGCQYLVICRCNGTSHL